MQRGVVVSSPGTPHRGEGRFASFGDGTAFTHSGLLCGVRAKNTRMRRDPAIAEMLRNNAGAAASYCLEPIRMEQNLIALEPTRIEHGVVLLIAGLGEPYTQQTVSGIPAQWQRFLSNFVKL